MIYLASDHAGLFLKNKLNNWFKQKGVLTTDIGPFEFDGEDSYVPLAKKGIEEFLKSKDNNLLILVCGSGVGMNIVANRYKGIRAVLAYNKKQAIQSKLHNNANCLCLGARNTSFFKAKGIINAFLKTEFLGGKYLKRIESIDSQIWDVNMIFE